MRKLPEKESCRLTPKAEIKGKKKAAGMNEVASFLFLIFVTPLLKVILL